MRALKCLDLSDNLIHAVGASALANAFYDDDHVEVLDVSGNPILDAGGKQLATLVSKNGCLRCVCIRKHIQNSKVFSMLSSSTYLRCTPCLTPNRTSMCVYLWVRVPV